MASKNRKTKKKETEVVPAPFSRLDVYKELQTINERVSNILENYEEFQPTVSYTDEEMDYVKNLIAKYEENRLEKKAALKTINTFYRVQLEKFRDFDTKSTSTNEIPSEFLKDIQHHEFRNAYDVALKALDKLKSIMSTATRLSIQTKSLSSSTEQADKSKGDENVMDQRRMSTAFSMNSDLRTDYTNIYLKQSKLEAINTTQEKELKSIKAAYNELLEQKQKSTDAISEVDKLKKELNQAHKEVEILQRNLEKQQKALAKQEKLSTAMTTYSNSNYNDEISTTYMQEVEISQRDLQKQQKTLGKMSTTIEAAKTNHTPSTYSSTTFDDLSSPGDKHKVKFDTNSIVGTESIGENMHENKFKPNKLTKKYTPYNNKLKLSKPRPVLNLKSEDKNEKVPVSMQYKTGSRFPDIPSPKSKTGNRIHSPQHKPREPVKLPEIDHKSGNSHSLLKESPTELTTENNTSGSTKISQQTSYKHHQKLSSPEVVAKTLLDLHDKKQLTTNQIKQEQKDALNILIKEPVHGLTKEEQFDKAAQATVEYVNMSHSINEVGQILKEHCEQNNKVYQNSVVQTEEESRNIITKHYSGFVENIISAVDFVDNELQRDGILGGGSFNQALKSHWFDPIESDCVSAQNQSKDQDFITKITNALEMISYNCKSYLQHIKLSIIEHEKRLSALQNASPQIYQKCVKQLEKGSQYPNVIDKSLNKGSQQMCSMLEDHIAKIQSAIESFNHRREFLVMETKSKIQSHIPEIIQIIDRISSLCAEDGNDTSDELQNSVKKLNKLCKSTQIIREHTTSTSGEVTIDKATSFSELSKSVLKEVQGQVKNIISNKLGVLMPDQLDFEVTGKSVYNTVKQPVLTTLSSKHIRNLNQDFHDPLSHLSVNSDGHNINKLNTHQRSLTWDPLIHHSPLAIMKESADFTKGITGITIGKRINDDKQMASLVGTKETLPKLHIKDGRRKYHPDNMKIKITIKNRLIRGYGSGSKGEPLECFKVTSFNNGKSH